MDPQGQLSNYLVGVLHNYWFSTSQAEAAGHQPRAVRAARVRERGATAERTGDPSAPRRC